MFAREGREESCALQASYVVVPTPKTLVWQLEATHLQTYYCLLQTLSDGVKDGHHTKHVRTTLPLVTRSTGTFF